MNAGFFAHKSKTKKSFFQRLFSAESDLQSFTVFNGHLKLSLSNIDSAIAKLNNGSESVAYPNLVPPSSSIANPLDVFSELTGVYTDPSSWRAIDSLQRAYASERLYTISLEKRQRVSQINEEIRKLKIHLKSCQSIDLVLHLRALIMELHSLISFQISEIRKVVKCFKKQLADKKIFDRRKNHQTLLRSHYKVLSDFSGCEEEILLPLSRRLILFLTLTVK